MNIDRDVAAKFDRPSVMQIFDWLVRSFAVEYEESQIVDRFYPHSFLNLYDEPAQGVVDVFALASHGTQRKLIRAIEMLLPAARPDSLEFPNFDLKRREQLLRDCLVMVVGCGCMGAARQVATIGAVLAPLWAAETLDEQIFDRCFYALGRLSERVSTSPYASKAISLELEQALLTMISSHYFRAGQSPFALCALVRCSPASSMDYVASLGFEVARLHQGEDRQSAHANVTAEFIVKRASVYLRESFPKLQFRWPGDRDRWLVDALFSPTGPLAIPPETRKGPVIYAHVRGARNKISHRFENEHFVYYRPPTGANPAPAEIGTAVSRAKYSAPSGDESSRAFVNKLFDRPVQAILAESPQ